MTLGALIFADSYCLSINTRRANPKNNTTSHIWYGPWVTENFNILKIFSTYYRHRSAWAYTTMIILRPRGASAARTASRRPLSRCYARQAAPAGGKKRWQRRTQQTPGAIADDSSSRHTPRDLSYSWPHLRWPLQGA